MTDSPVIEAQLLRWSESHNGRTVTLQLPSDGEHPFRGLPCGPANGARLALAVVLINDDETTTPVEPPPADEGARLDQIMPPNWRESLTAELANPPSTAPKGGRLAQQAGILCGDARFRKFLEEVICLHPVDENGAKLAVYGFCCIESRVELDADPDAAAQWEKLHTRYILWRDNP